MEAAMIQPVELKTNNMTDPLGINGGAPEFSWKLNPDSTGNRQTCWAIQAAEDPDFKSAMLWDSGRISDSKCSGHLWKGPDLKSRQRVCWRVKLWDENGQESEWSAPAWFETGLLTLRDWDVQWIGFPGGWSGHAVYFQKNFPVPRTFRQARLYIGGPSWSEVWINGIRLGGNSILQPAQTDFSKSWHYRTFDIMGFLCPGENVLAVHAGAGWYGTPAVCYRIETDGQLVTRSHFLSLPFAWKSPVFRNSVYGGEEYDARLELDPSWTIPGGKCLPCGRAAFRVSGLTGRPRGLEEEPIVPQEEIHPVGIKSISENRWSIDFGRNFAGWCRLKVHAAPGTRIEMLFSEIRYADGSANQENLLGETAMDAYIAKGDPDGEIFEPHFTYHGFRYVEIRGLPYEPEPDTLTGIVLRTDCRRTGTFTCDNELANRIFTMIRRTEESNLHGVPTDCPQRTERMGWLNDLIARCESGLYLLDESNLLEKWLHDIAEAQNPDTGDVPMTAPFHWGFEPDPTCSSFLESAWLCHAFYGKTALLEELYPGFLRWTNCLLDLRDADGILRAGGEVGDWVPPLQFNNGHESPQNFTVPHELVSTALLHYTLLLQIRIGSILNKDVSTLKKTEEQVRQDFLRCFRAGPGRLKEESQSGYAFAVYCGLFTGDESEIAADRLAKLFLANHCKHTTGNIGTKYLLAVLSEYGHADLVWKLITSEDYPGWGYMLANGATTLWERWELAEGSGMNSHNHPMLGSPCFWFFRYAAGIRILPETSGFDRFGLSPVFPAGLNHADAVYDSCLGRIHSEWARHENVVDYGIEIPAGAEAEVCLPDRPAQVLPGGKYTFKIQL